MKTVSIILATIVAIALLLVGCSDNKSKETKEIVKNNCSEKVVYTNKNPPDGFWAGSVLNWQGKLKARPGADDSNTVFYSNKADKSCNISSKQTKVSLSITTVKLVGAYMANPFAVVESCLNADAKKKACSIGTQFLIRGKKFTLTLNYNGKAAYKVILKGSTPKNICSGLAELLETLERKGEKLNQSVITDFQKTCQQL